MVSQNLQIKVKLDIPNARDFEQKLSGIHPKIKFDADISQLKRELNNKLKVTPKINIKGAQNSLKGLNNSIRSLRNLAKEPIKINFDVDRGLVRDLGRINEYMAAVEKNTKRASSAMRGLTAGSQKNTENIFGLRRAYEEANKYANMLHRLRLEEKQLLTLQERSKTGLNPQQFTRLSSVKQEIDLTNRLFEAEKRHLRQHSEIIAALNKRATPLNAEMVEAIQRGEYQWVKQTTSAIEKNLSERQRALTQQARKTLGEIERIHKKIGSLKGMQQAGQGAFSDKDEAELRKYEKLLTKKREILKRDVTPIRKYDSELADNLYNLSQGNRTHAKRIRENAQDEAYTKAITRGYNEVTKAAERAAEAENKLFRIQERIRNGHATANEEYSEVALRREAEKARQEYEDLRRQYNFTQKEKDNLEAHSHNDSYKKEIALAEAQTARQRASQQAYRDVEASLKRQLSLQKEIIQAQDAAARRHAKNQLNEEKRIEAEGRQRIQQYGVNGANERRLNSLSGEVVDARRRTRRRTRYGITATMDVFQMAQSGAYAVAGAINSMNEVDKAITSVTKVANSPQKDIDAFTKSIYKNATTVGKTAPEYAAAVEKWITAGYNLKKSIGLARDSVTGSFVGNIDVEDMVKYMDVPLQAYKKQKLKSKDIINAMNAVSNDFPVEMEDLGQGYEKASSVAKSNGTTFSQLTGMITGAQTATRAGGDVIGRAIKAIMLNFSKMSSGVTKMDKARTDYFGNLGVNLRDSNGQMKSTYQIMNDLSKVWGHLSRQQKQDAAYYAAGKEHANVFQGMLDQWSQVKKSAKEADAQMGQGKNGSAFQEMSKQSKSVEFHLKGLANAWQQFISDVIGGRQGVNNIVDSLTGLVKVMDNLANNKAFVNFAKFAAGVAGLTMANKAVRGITGTLGDYSGALFDSISDVYGKKAISDRNKKRKNLAKNFWAYATGTGDIIDDIEGISEEHRQRQSHRDKKANKKFAKAAADYYNKTGKHVSIDFGNEDIRRTEKASQSIKNVGKEAAETGSKVGKAAGTMTKGARVMGALGSAASIAASFLGPVGLAIDVLGLTLSVLQLTGAKPFEKIEKALMPTKSAMDDLNKSTAAYNKTISETSQTLGKNNVYNGGIADTLKNTKDFGKFIDDNTITKADGTKQLGKTAFQEFKAKFNKEAKENGLKIRIKSNNIEVMQDAVNTFNAQLRTKSIDNAIRGAKEYRKEISALKKLTSDKTLQKLWGTTHGYEDYAGDIKAYKQSGWANDKYLKDLQNSAKDQERVYRMGDGAEKVWNSKAGRKLEAQIAKANKHVQSQMSGLAKTINSGYFEKADYMSLGTDFRQQATVAEGRNLHYWTKQRSILGDINDRLKAGSDLTRQERDYLAKQGGSLATISRHYDKITSAQKEQIQQLNGQVDKRIQARSDRLRDILSADGVSKQRQDEIINKMGGSNTQYVEQMGAYGTVGAAVLGVGAKYQSQYGSQWNTALAQQQTAVDSWSKENADSQVYRSLTNEDGSVNTDVVAKINSEVNKGWGKDKHGRYGYKKGSMGQVLTEKYGVKIDPTTGQIDFNSLKQFENVAGASDLPTLFQALGKGTATSQQQLQALAATKQLFDKNGKITKKSGGKQQLADTVKAQGKGATNDWIEQQNWTPEQKAAAHDYVNNHVDQSGRTAREQKQNKSVNAIAKTKGNFDKKNKKDQKRLQDLLNAYGSKDKAREAIARNGLYKNKKERNQALDALDNMHVQKGKKGGSHKTGNKQNDKNNKNNKSNKSNKSGKSNKDNKKPPKGSSWWDNLYKKQEKVNKPSKTDKAKDKATKAVKQLKQGKLGKDYKLTAKEKAALKKGTKEERELYNKYKKAFDKVDKNKDGKLSAAEKKAIQKKVAAEAKEKRAAEQKEEKKQNKKSNKSSKSNKSNKSNRSNKGSSSSSSGKSNKSNKSGKSKKNAKMTIKTKSDADKTIKKIQKQAKSAKAQVAIKGKDQTKKAVASAKKSIKNIKSQPIAIKGKDQTKKATSSAKKNMKSVKNRNVAIKGKNLVKNAVAAAKSSLKGIKNRNVNINAKDKASGKANAVKGALASIKDKTTKITAQNRDALRKISSVAAAIATIPSEKTVTINVSKNETHTIITKHKKGKGKSVAIGDVINPADGAVKSLSVASDNPQAVSAINGTAQSMGVRDASDSVDDTKVSEDYWRYMGKQLYTGLPLNEQSSKLENAVTQADEDMNKLINIARQKVDVDRKQIEYQKSMQSSYQAQLNDVMGKLRGYGFRTNGNQITNLDLAKGFKGDQASKVEELLSTYQSVYQSLSDITTQINDLNTDIWQQNKNITDYQDQQDQKRIEAMERELELVERTATNEKNLAERAINSLSDTDYGLKLKISANEINTQNKALEQLIAQFNKISAMTTRNTDNAKTIESDLSSLKDTILETADSVLELQNNMRDASIEQYTSQLEKFTNTTADNIDRLKNNVTELQDGLLSGTNYNDLLSATLDVTDFDQASGYQRQVQQRLDLEKQLDSALDAFSKKNVERTGNVANEQLRIEQDKYSQLIHLASEYSKGFTGQIKEIEANYKGNVAPSWYGDVIEVGTARSKEYTKAMVKYQNELIALRDKYNDAMARTNNAEEKSKLNQQFAIQQMNMQAELYREQIEQNRQAIVDMEAQLNNGDLTTAQRQTLKDNIAQYEKDNITAQANIKDAIRERFEYENTLLQEQADKYKKVSDTLTNLVTLGKTLSLKPNYQASLLEQQYKGIEKQFNNYIDIVNGLRQKQSSYDEGSFEWKLLQTQIDNYGEYVNSTVSDLLSTSRDQFENTMAAVSKNLEKQINAGKDASEMSFENDIWIEGVSKELRLEQMRQKSIQLENDVVNKRLAALDAQERMSKIEADYVDKQIDVYNAQQKLDNTLGKKDTKVLTTDANGKFNWAYTANQEDVDAAREAVTQAKADLEDYKKNMKSQFVTSVEGVIDGAKDGSLTPQEVKDRLQQLNDSYGTILDDIPTYNKGTLEDIIKRYNDYAEKNKGILDIYGTSKDVGNLEGYKQILSGFTDQFKAAGKDIATTFGNELRAALAMPVDLAKKINDNTKVLGQSYVIQKQVLEFPNVTDPTGFEDAIKNLPQIAKQQLQSKNI